MSITEWRSDGMVAVPHVGRIVGVAIGATIRWRSWTSNQGVAERLVITERAVEKHVTAILDKLGLAPAPDDHRRVLAVLAYLRS